MSQFCKGLDGIEGLGCTFYTLKVDINMWDSKIDKEYNIGKQWKKLPAGTPVTLSVYSNSDDTHVIRTLCGNWSFLIIPHEIYIFLE